jgi:hypothetical protein
MLSSDGFRHQAGETAHLRGAQAIGSDSTTAFRTRASKGESATVEQITTVERPTPSHLYWPKLDVDLLLESIRNPERFPLVSRG